MSIERKTLIDLAKKYLGPDEIAEISINLEEGGKRKVSFYLLGVIDRMWSDKKISDEEARKAYDIINLPPEEKAEVRTSKAKF